MTEHTDRMADRFGLTFVDPNPGYIPPRWVAKARGSATRGEENYWSHRVNGGGTIPLWDHVRAWQRDGHRYVTSEPYNIREDMRAHATRDIEERLAYDLAPYPGVVADGYVDNVWQEWTALIVVRHIEAPPLAPGAVFSIQEIQKWQALS